MSDKFFIDTNIIVYANDASSVLKNQIAKNIILSGIHNDNIVISAQVLSEFYVTVTRKIKKTLKPEIALQEIELLRSVEIIEIDYDLIIQAIELSLKFQLSYWDSLIIATALNSKCSILYTEDLSHNQIIEGLRIVDPFR
ncbi:MAG: PIN domain-containing protein [Calditrichaceae bacterium]